MTAARRPHPALTRLGQPPLPADQPKDSPNGQA